MNKKIISLLAAILMIFNSFPVDAIINNDHSVNNQLEVTKTDDGEWIITESSYYNSIEYGYTSLAERKKRPAEPGDIVKGWVKVDIAKILMDALDINEVTLTVEARRTIEYKQSYTVKRNPGPGEYKIGESFEVPVPRSKFATAISIKFPDGRDSRVVVEAHSVPGGLDVNIDFRAHTGVATKWFGNESNRPTDIKADYKHADSTVQIYSVTLPTDDQNMILRQDEGWQWKDHPNPVYLKLIPDEFLGINDTETIKHFRVEINDAKVGEVDGKNDSKFIYQIEGTGYVGWDIFLREKLPVKFDLKGAKFVDETAAFAKEQYVAHSLKVGEKFGTLDPVVIPGANDIKEIPKSKDGIDQNFMGWSLSPDSKEIVELTEQVITENTTFYAVYTDKPQGKANIKYVDQDGSEIEEKYRLEEESYIEEITGNAGEQVEYTLTKENAPKFVGYTFVEVEIPSDAKYADPATATVIVKYQKIASIIPENKEKPEGYVTVTFKVVDNAKLNGEAKDIVYFVNPKDGVQITEFGEAYHIFRLAADGGQLKYAVPEVSAEPKYAVKYHKDGDTITTWAYDKFELVEMDIVEDLEFTAQVEKKPSVVPENPDDKDYVKVTFDAGENGKITEGDTEVWVLKDEKVKLTAPTVEANPGYKFISWEPNVDEELTFSEDTTINAKYNKKPSVVEEDPKDKDYVKVTFDAGENGKITEGDAEVWVLKDEKVKLTAPTVEANPGYKFIGWEPNVEVELTFSEDTTINAKYDKKPSVVPDNPEDKDYVKVTFDAGENGKITEGDAEVWVLKDEKVKLTAPTVEANKGWKFIGWEPNVEVELTFSEDTTINAKYNKKPSVVPENPDDKDYVKVTFDAGENGKITEGDAEVWVLKDEKVKLTAPTVEANKGWKFTGWDKPLTGKFTEDTTITATYVEIAKGTVTYEFKAAEEDLGLPYEVTSLLPTDDKEYYVGETVKAEPSTFREVEGEVKGNKGIWVFEGWNPTELEIKEGVNKFVGTWKFVAKTPSEIVVNFIINDEDTDKGEFAADDAGGIYKTLVLPYGYDAKNLAERAPMVVAKEGYEFIGWDKKFEGILTENTNYVALFKKVEKQEPEDPGYFYEPTPDYKKEPKKVKKEAEKKFLLAYRGYVIGNDSREFMPTKGITRAEVAQMFARALEFDKAAIPTVLTPYTDVPVNAWYYDAVQTTSAAGIFKGTDLGTFEPNREITKAELIATIARFQRLANRPGNAMNLRENHWATAEVEAAFQEGWLDIYTNGIKTFSADEVITREEVVTILNRAFGRRADEAYIDKNAQHMRTFIDVTKDMWSYYEIMTAANTYLVDKNWTHHAKFDSGVNMNVEDIEWIPALVNNDKEVEVVEQVKFRR